jgi:ArsR family transcriptional regulator, virulence genes transcriptional regulator
MGSVDRSAMDIAALQKNAKRAGRLLKAMSNHSRLLILCQLAEGEKSVSQLEGLIGLGQSALSQHLARLRRDELVRTRRQAQSIYYALEGNEATRVIGVLHDLYCRTEAGETREFAVARSGEGGR